MRRRAAVLHILAPGLTETGQAQGLVANMQAYFRFPAGVRVDRAQAETGRVIDAGKRLDGDAFRLLVDRTRDYAIFMLDPSGRVASWNEGARRLFGYEPDEIIGQHLSIFHPPDATERNPEQPGLETAERDGRVEDEGWRVRRDGTRFWASVSITALRNEAGELVGFGAVSRDLTDRRQTELELRENEERFRSLVESTLDYAIFMLDPEGCVASWNPGAQRIKGYAPHEIIGRHFSTFYTPDAIAAEWPQHELREAARLGRFEDEGWRVRKDGSWFWANVVITAIRGSDGALRGFSKVTRDMTVRKAHEERIERLRRELEERVRELGAANRELAQKSAENESFVYSVSHDLRSPLVNLQGFSQELLFTSAELAKVLSDESVPVRVRTKAMNLVSDELTESVTFIRNAVRHLGNIVDGLLRLSRVGRIEYVMEPVDLCVVLADLLSAMHSTIAAAGAQVVSGPLPAIYADRNAIGQVFANIIDNAIKHLAEGRPGRIEISSTTDDPPVIAISDNGIGIPQEYQSKIFKVFQQVHQGPGRGEGMGLAIVHRIIERHGGRIWFESIPGTGTTFFFSAGRLATPAAATPSDGGS
jgi:PAS domain S-box-containing protein